MSRRQTSASSAAGGAAGGGSAGGLDLLLQAGMSASGAAQAGGGSASGGGSVPKRNTDEPLPMGCVRQNVGKRGSSWKARVTVNTITLQRCFKTKEEADCFAMEAREYKIDDRSAEKLRGECVSRYRTATDK